MKKSTNQAPSDRVEQKTAPRGMAPDKAHGSHELTAALRNSETEETFNNSPQNAESKQTTHLK
jgi:hypothetical protein